MNNLDQNKNFENNKTGFQKNFDNNDRKFIP